MTKIGAIVLAAGQGRRMGADKALLDLGGKMAVERVVEGCEAAGVEWVGIVRAAGADALPDALMDRVISVSSGEMLDSVRAGVTALPSDCDGAVIFPVDCALVSEQVIRAVVSEVQEGREIVLPIESDRPGHPIGLSRACCQEVCGDVGSLRDVVAADRERVHGVPVEDQWIHRDLDTPEDLASARAWLASAAGAGATPSFVLGRNQSTNLADSLPSVVRRWIYVLILSSVLSVFGYAFISFCIMAAIWVYSQITGYTGHISFFDPLEYSWAVTLCFLLSVYLVHRAMITKFRRWYDRCELRPASLRFLPKARSSSRAPAIEVDLADVGNLELMPAEVRLHYGSTTSQGRREIVVPVLPTTAEDDFERLENHMREFVAGGTYSIIETDEPRYSRRWEPGELFLWGAQADGADLDLGDEAAGRSELRVGGHQMTVEWQGTNLLVRHQGEETLTLDLSAGRAWDARGMVVAVVERSAFQVVVRLGSGQTLSLQFEDQSVLWNDKRVGRIRIQGGVMSLRLVEPLPAPAAVLALLARRGEDAF